MRFLIVNTDYPDFLAWLYAQHPGLDRGSYEEQMRARVDSLFGVADFYSKNLRALGHEAWDVHANNQFMQKSWAREHGMRLPPDFSWRFGLRRRLIPWVNHVPDQRWLYEILAAQIKYYRPDVLLNHSMEGISGGFLQQMKSDASLLVGQIAAPLPHGEDYGCYDLILSSLPNFVAHFRGLGIPAEMHRLAFEPSILGRFDGRSNGDIAVSFVGTLSSFHQTRVLLLEQLCRTTAIKVWGIDGGHLPRDSAIKTRHVGPAWGVQMYEVLRASKMTVNHHISVANGYANNMRMYEATGVGALLITDWKENLDELFDLGKEVMTYRSADECTELINHYLEHDTERETIASAGQRRTLQEHTYLQRMNELVRIVRKYV